MERVHAKGNDDAIHGMLAMAEFTGLRPWQVRQGIKAGELEATRHQGIATASKAALSAFRARHQQRLLDKAEARRLARAM